MKKNRFLVFILVLVLLCSLLAACDPESKVITYTVSFNLDGGVGQTQSIEAIKAGDTVTIPEYSVTRDGYNFKGWKNGDTVYSAGQTFTMPQNDVTLVAQWEKIVLKYAVIFDINGGSGIAPTIEDQEAGATITIPATELTRECYTFGGWRYDQKVYQANDTITMPAQAITLVAIWNQNDPSFSKASYAYDRLGAGPLELPLNLQGSNLYIVEINDEAIPNTQFSYNTEKGCLVIAEDYVLALAMGEYSIKAITDGDGEAALCTLTIDNSVQTSFDEITSKSVNVAKEAGVTFTIDYNGTTITSLKHGNSVIAPQYYVAGDNTLQIKSELIKRYTGTVDFVVTLSNHDSYSFEISNNVIFYSDYDFSYIHDESISATGQNPLYQYITSSSIAIVDGPDGMEGKVLRFIPSMEGNVLDVHGLYTLKRADWESTWRNVNYNSNKNYVFSFDYMTENTPTDSAFAFQEATGSWKHQLLLGAENDGALHHFECVVKGSDISQGTYIWAKVLGGTLYFDNFSVVEVDAIPTLSVSSSCTVGHDYTVSFDSQGWNYSVLVDGVATEKVTADIEAKTITISSEVISLLDTGVHEIGIKTSLFTINAQFNIVDDRASSLKDSSVNYSYEAHQDVKLYGSFDNTLQITSLKQKEKDYNNGYAGGWSFAHNNTEKDYKEYASLTTGLNDEGYITLSVELLDMLWGTSEFTISFNNGNSVDFSVVSTDVQIYTDYDNTTIKGQLGGNDTPNTPFSSGFAGTVNIQADENGNNRLVISSVAGEPTYYSVKINNHGFEWYNASGNADYYYRVTFDYQISGLDQDSVWFEIWSMASEDKESNLFGSYDAMDLYGDYHRVKFYLKADGEKHTFDSGYFTYHDGLRLCRVMMPGFEAAEGKYVAFDNYRLFSTSVENGTLTAPESYNPTASEAFAFTFDQQVVSVKIDGQDIEYTKEGNQYTLNAQAINALSFGQHKLVVMSSKARYIASFNVVDSRQSVITETSKNVQYGKGDVKVAGNFDTTLKVASVTRQGSDSSWDPTYSNPGAVQSSYVTVASDGLTISQILIDKLYGTTKLAVTFDNGNTVSFDLISNIKYFSDYDETNVFIDLGGNSQICQDRGMIDIVDVDGNHMMKYVPADATLGHTYNSHDNFCFTVDNRNNASYNWYDWYPTKGSKLIIFFDYEVVLGDKTDSYYTFSWQDVQGVWHNEALTGSGHFEIELDESAVGHFGIHAPGAGADFSLFEGTYMLIDSIGFGEINA